MPSARTLLLPWIEIAKAIFRPLVAREQASVLRVFSPLILTVVVTWFITVPVHELLHVVGCLITGGQVTEVTIQPIYGGTLLSRLFDFVVAGGDYAGQVRGFDTRGSDFCYIVMDCFPFLLTIFFGVSLLELAAHTGNSIWHGVGIVQTLLPVASITGDYYEMGSITLTRILGYRPDSIEAGLYRGDDLFRVISSVWESEGPGGMLIVAGAVVLGFIFLTATLDLSILFARLIARKRLEKRGDAG